MVKFQKYPFVYLLLVLLFSCSNSSMNKGSGSDLSEFEWSRILKSCSNEKRRHPVEIDVEDFKSSIIAYSFIYGKTEVAHEIENLATNEYDPVLYLLYLSWELNRNRKKGNLINHLMRYYEREIDNSIPCYLLSYYFLNNSDYSRSLKYLVEGNKRAQYNSYYSNIKHILFNYMSKDAQSEICALSSQFSAFDNDLMIILRDLSSKLSDDSNGMSYANEVVDMGFKIENQSNMLIEKLLGIAIQFDGTNNDLK